MSDKETLIREWIQNVTKRKFPEEDFMKSLKDGILLCELVSKVKCRFVAYNKNPRSLEWMELENLQTFITESQKLGYPKITWKIESVNQCKSKDELCDVIFWLGDFSKKQPKFKGPPLDSRYNIKTKTTSISDDDEKDEERDEKKDVKKIEHKRTRSDVVGVYKKTVSSNSLNKRASASRVLINDDSDDDSDDDFIAKKTGSLKSVKSGFESPVSTTSELSKTTPTKKSHLKEIVSSDDDDEDTSKLLDLKEQIKKQKIILAKLKKETESVNDINSVKSPRKYDDQKVKVLKETFKKQLQEAEDDHKKQMEALKQKYKNELRDQKKEYLREMKEQKIENIRTFHDLKADLVDKFRMKEEAYENQIKDYKKKLISAEEGEFVNKRSSTYTRGDTSQHSNHSPETPIPSTPTTTTSDTATPKLILKRKNSFLSKSLEFDESDKFSLNDEMDEFGRIVKKEEIEDEDLEDEEDLEDNQEEKKLKVLNSLSELRMKVENFEKLLNLRWEDADIFYIIDTLKEILKS